MISIDPPNEYENMKVRQLFQTLIFFIGEEDEKKELTKQENGGNPDETWNITHVIPRDTAQVLFGNMVLEIIYIFSTAHCVTIH